MPEKRTLITWLALLALGGLLYATFPSSRFISIAEADNGLELAEKASDPAAKDARAVVVELFTSQSCFSCPPAEAYLRELSEQPGVITLEFHVDYWNDLDYGMAGQWKDPFSSPEATARQRAYNVKIRGKTGVYTPQMVVDGWQEAVGARRGDVEDAIGKAERARLKKAVEFKPVIDAEGNIVFDLSRAEGGPFDLVFVRLIKRHVTQVAAGENKGKTLTSYNIVRDWAGLGDWTGEAGTIKAKVMPLEDNESCAVLLQDKDTLRIYGAAFCAGHR